MEKLLNGTLGALYDRCRAGFDAIDVGIHCTAYERTHDLSFAETEFAGKYLSACVRFARRGDETARAHAAAVAAERPTWLRQARRTLRKLMMHLLLQNP